MGVRSLREQIRVVQTDAKIALAAEVVAGAFAGLAATEWLIPDPGERVHRLREVFAVTIAHAAQRGGVVYLLEDRVGEDGAGSHLGLGAGVWIARTRRGGEPPRYQSRVRSAAGPYAERFLALDRLFEDRHPAGAHHHLVFLAALPHGQGIGSALLRRHHAHLDAEGIPAYLEAASQDSVRLYRTHGYRPFGKPFGLPNRALFYPMWRPPMAGGRT